MGGQANGGGVGATQPQFVPVHRPCFPFCDDDVDGGQANGGGVDATQNCQGSQCGQANGDPNQHNIDNVFGDSVKSLKSCIDSCPVKNRYRGCVTNCLRNRSNSGPFPDCFPFCNQQGGLQNCEGSNGFMGSSENPNTGGGGQVQTQNNKRPIISQQGEVQNCQGMRCNQKMKIVYPGRSYGSMGSSDTPNTFQNCRGSQCNQNNGQSQGYRRSIQNCTGSQCTRTDG